MNEDIQKFVLAVDADENVVAKDLLKKAMAKKVADRLKDTLKEESNK